MKQAYATETFHNQEFPPVQIHAFHFINQIQLSW